MLTTQILLDLDASPTPPETTRPPSENAVPSAPPPAPLSEATLHAELAAFAEFGEATQVESWTAGERELPVYRNEFWTARQRQAHSLHEISYRACFKPQLPRFFIDRLTAPGDIVFDPFMGRGTTPLEAALAGRIPWGSDVSPLAERLIAPRLNPPPLDAVSERLRSIQKRSAAKSIIETADADLLAFFHPQTLRDLTVLREYLIERDANGELDPVDAWIRLVATNRLTGHSAGFFSVYTLPPNQATSAKRQRKINEKRGQTPPFRDIVAIIEKKSRHLHRDLNDGRHAPLAPAREAGRFATASAADAARAFPSPSVSLVVTSPPFLDVVQYAADNWLRCWFNGIDAQAVPIWNCRNVDAWRECMTRALAQCGQLLKPGGWVAFEVGEVRRGSVRLEDQVVEAGVDAGLDPILILINQQDFTKTANCWGVSNNSAGTNTNRVVLMRKPAGDRQLTTA